MSLLREYVQTLLEIVPPVRDWLRYSQAKKKRWNQFRKEYELAKREYEQIAANEELLDDFDDYLRGKYQDSIREDDVSSFLRRVLRDHGGITYIISSVEAVADAMEQDWEPHYKQKFLRSFYDAIIDEEVSANLSRFIDRIGEPDPDFSLRYYDNPERWESYLNTLFDLIRRTKKEIEQTKTKLNANYKYWAMGAEDRPETEDIEILYHASANARELLEKGFSKKFDQRGIGLGRPEEGVISFTYDQKIAYDISNALKVGVMIAHGELKGDKILGWMRDEGIDSKGAAEVHGRAVLQPDEPWKVWRLYEYWIWNTKMGRGNPVFMTNAKDLMKYLATKTKDDVGVLKAKVNMRHPGVSFVKGEREFRVPPEAIVSVMKRVA